MTTSVILDWVATGTQAKAHLLWDDGVTWCGSRLDAYEPAPYRARCSKCIAAIEKYAELAAAPPPALVTERLMVIVTRPADANGNAVSWLKTQANKKPSWTFEFVSVQAP